MTRMLVGLTLLISIPFPLTAQQLFDSIPRDHTQPIKPLSESSSGSDLMAGCNSLSISRLLIESNGSANDTSAPKSNTDKGYVGQKIIHENESSPANSKKKLRIGGYAKLDFIHDFDSATVGSNGEHFNLYALIPFEGTPAEQLSNSVLTARESRLFVDSTLQTQLGELNTKFEGDFFGSYSSEKLVAGFGLRLRRAYGDLRGFRAGQDFSTFMDIKAFPETLTISGPVGFTFMMQGVLRYSRAINEKLTVITAIENPYTDFTPWISGFSRSDRSPDFHLAAHRKTSNGHCRVRSFLRSGSVVNDSTTEFDTSSGWGLGLSGLRNFGDQNQVRFDVKHGVGLGRYVFEGGLGNQGWAFDGVNLSPIPASGGYIDFRRRWNKYWRSNFIYGFASFENPVFLGPNANRFIESYHFNLLFNPVAEVTAGAEYSISRRVVEDGRTGKRNRLQISMKYNF